MAPDVFHVDQGLIAPREDAAVNGPCFQIERRRGVDLLRERIKPRGAQLGLRECDVLERFHQVAENGALRAAGGLHFLFQLFLVIRLALGAHDHNRKFFVIIDARDHIVGQQHVLVEQVADCQIFRVIADRHGGDDFLAVEENRQRALDGDGRLDAGPGLIDAGDALGQPRIKRIGPDDVALAVLTHAVIIADILAQHENCPS